MVVDNGGSKQDYSLLFPLYSHWATRDLFLFFFESIFCLKKGAYKKNELYLHSHVVVFEPVLYVCARAFSCSSVIRIRPSNIFTFRELEKQKKRRRKNTKLTKKTGTR